MPELITFGESMGAMAPGERGLLRYCDSFKLRLAGAESNTAIGLCKLGHTAGWVGAVGNDGVGDFVLAAMRAEGVDTTAVKTDPHHRTGLLLKELSAGETSVYYYRENSAASHFSANDIPYAYLRDAKILHISQYFISYCTFIVFFVHKFVKRFFVKIIFLFKIHKLI